MVADTDGKAHIANRYLPAEWLAKSPAELAYLVVIQQTTTATAGKTYGISTKDGQPIVPHKLQWSVVIYDLDRMRHSLAKRFHVDPPGSVNTSSDGKRTSFSTKENLVLDEDGNLIGIAGRPPFFELRSFLASMRSQGGSADAAPSTQP